MKNSLSKEVNKELGDAREQIISAAEAGKKLCIAGSSTKHFLAPRSAHDGKDDQQVEMFSLSGNTGIVSYQPSELVITVRAATKLSEVVQALAEKSQLLGFEPPSFGTAATIGGTVASALNGPARPYLGSIRDAVLGTKIMTGTGDIARFGGEVMKNVAGYDVSRLLVGSMGSLSPLLEVSLRVQPAAEAVKSVCLPCDETEALKEMARLRKMSLPLSGLCFADKKLHVRLAGSEIAVHRAQRDLDQFVEDEPSFWQALNEQQLGFFNSPTPLWRLTLPYGTPLDAAGLSGERLWDWGGGLCWLRTAEAETRVRETAKKLGGAASLFRSSSLSAAPSTGQISRLRKKLKLAFDPNNVFVSRGTWQDASS